MVLLFLSESELFTSFKWNFKGILWFTQVHDHRIKKIKGKNRDTGNNTIFDLAGPVQIQMLPVTSRTASL